MSGPRSYPQPRLRPRWLGHTRSVEDLGSVFLHDGRLTFSALIYVDSHGRRLLERRDFEEAERHGKLPIWYFQELEVAP